MTTKTKAKKVDTAVGVRTAWERYKQEAEKVSAANRIVAELKKGQDAAKKVLLEAFGKKNRLEDGNLIVRRVWIEVGEKIVPAYKYPKFAEGEETD